jgi:3-deoxy-D-manno-octulosonate 8-phosphate phosphatase (KDO 8-P phosphatase)
MSIKLLIVDVDGTLTDGTFYYGDGNLELKAFNTKDGAILKMLPQLGIDVVMLTGRESEAVTRRAAELGVMAIQKNLDKVSKSRELLDERDVEHEQVAYIGDDLNDYAAMKLCGFRACPADAVEQITICDYVSLYNGGHGAVRDVCEEILRRDGKYDEFLEIWE